MTEPVIPALLLIYALAVFGFARFKQMNNPWLFVCTVIGVNVFVWTCISAIFLPFDWMMIKFLPELVEQANFNIVGLTLIELYDGLRDWLWIVFLVGLIFVPAVLNKRKILVS